MLAKNSICYRTVREFPPGIFSEIPYTITVHDI